VKDDAGRVIAGPVTVLGRADGRTAYDNDNEHRDPMLRFGDTPLGTYSVVGFRAAGNADEASRLGPNNRIQLDPIGVKH